MKIQAIYIGVFALFSIALVSTNAMGQITHETLDSWIEDTPFFDKSKKDSLLIWAEELNKLNAPRSTAYALRMKGLSDEYAERMPEATDYFLQFLERAKSYKNVSDEMSATGDLVYIYITTKQYEKAKKLLLDFTDRPNKEELNQRKLSIFYNNLGICYNNLGLGDSSVIMYEKALMIKETLGDRQGMADLRINMSNLLIKQGKYNEAYVLTQANLDYLKTVDKQQDLWYNLINMGGILNGLGNKSAAESRINEALEIATASGSLDKQQQSLDMLSKIYFENAAYKKAYSTLRQSNKLSTQVINENTNERIAELSESFNAKERELENSLLKTELEVAKNRQSLYILSIVALFLLAGLAFYSYLKNKSKNYFISQQNDSLTQLNQEKNELMAMVSHDLSSPFTAIKMWTDEGQSMKSVEEFQLINQRINQTAKEGIIGISKILTIDKNQISRIHLESIDLSDFIRSLFTQFEPKAKNKAIDLDVNIEQDREAILSDYKMLYRALANLIDNAIKYSYHNSTVSIRTYERDDKLNFEVKDDGVGISINKQHELFKKYSNGLSEVTANEESYGLGLHIVKRIAEELGGEVSFQSEKGKGSIFTFSIPCR